ncbi:MAG TPA: hypothetical protein VHS76_06755 [Steroidobacteraceae bacterium]|jgi:hypothetical protein|nr:hypothetical protein [Steroidobacteraceae bacterium]
MASQRSLASRLIVWPAVLLGAAALGGDGVNLTVTNDGIRDVFVTVHDLSSTSSLTVVDHQRLNGFTSIPVSVSADGTGRANVSWTAITVDNHQQQCGHATKNGLADGASVNVHVDSDCSNW